LRTVFLSYASDDNAVPDEQFKGWVSSFDNCLKLEIQHLDEVRLWRDVRDLKERGLITDELRDNVRNAAILLVVLSRHYNNKQYTEFELTEFFDSRKPGELATDLIIPALPRPIDPGQIPPPLQGLRYIPFFDIDPETGKVEPFYDGYGKFVSEKYWDAVREVAKLIDTRLKGLPDDPRKATVYLAAPGLDQVTNHWKVYKELESQKCLITPIDPWPVNADKAKDHFGAGIKNAAFSVHLLGAVSNSARRADLNELTALQLDMAGARQKTDGKFRRLIWIPQDLKQPDAAQQALIKSLEDGTRLTAQDELVRGGLEMFKEIVRDELEQAGGAKAQPA
jgi:hypothetical protein